MPLIIGLTGGVASGKTFVGGEFQRLGVPLLEADDVGREVVTPPSLALLEIAQVFGAGFLNADGTLDRRRMRERVFADANALRQLEAITHPPIRARIGAWAAVQKAPYCILSAAILLESGMHTLVDRVLLVDAPEDVQLQRLVLRDRIAEPLARQMIAAQAARSLRLLRAHDVLDNRDTGRAPAPAIARLHGLYLQLAARGLSASHHPLV